MKELKYRIQSDTVQINIVESTGDLIECGKWLSQVTGPLGVDSESTGLETYGKDYLRVVQLGTATESWSIPVERIPWCKPVIASWLLKYGTKLILHNASFDLQVFEQNLGLKAESLWPKVVDTRILTHLVDPRGQEEGGIGQSLEQTTAHYVDAEAAGFLKGIPTRLARELRTTKAKIWAVPELIDHPDFHLYCGMDPVLTVRLYYAVEPLVPESSRHLIRYEHEIARICAYMERTGFLLDREYTEKLSETLKAEEAEASWHASAFFDVDSINSTAQVAAALEELNYQVTGRTPTGKPKVDVDLLKHLIVDNPEIGSKEHLAAAVFEGKKARKWRTTWLEHFLSGADTGQRVHASINPLRARTARMSISGIPAQTLPAGDPTVRQCFLADPGQLIASVDYDAQELRVLAALSGDLVMQNAFRNGADLHQMTADAAGVDRKVGKMTNFLKVYGGGAGKLSVGAGIPEDLAQTVLRGFSKTYPKVAEYSKRMQRQAEEQGYVVTPLGRVLPVDEDRPYSAVNYCVQSASRDVTCQGLIKLHRAGLTPYLRLPIHDEVLCSLPEKDAEWMKDVVAALMGQEFKGVQISASGKVGGQSWGSLYQ